MCAALRRGASATRYKEHGTYVHRRDPLSALLKAPRNPKQHDDIDGREGSTLMDWPCTPAYVRAFGRAFEVPVYASWRAGGFERELLRTNAATAPVVFEQPDGMHGRAGSAGREARAGASPSSPRTSRPAGAAPA